MSTSAIVTFCGSGCVGAGALKEAEAAQERVRAVMRRRGFEIGEGMGGRIPGSHSGRSGRGVVHFSPRFWCICGPHLTESCGAGTMSLINKISNYPYKPT